MALIFYLQSAVVIAHCLWLIDTNVISEMMCPPPESRVTAFLCAIVVDGLGLSMVTVWEILDGIGRRDPGRRWVDLADRFRDLLAELFEDCILAWSVANAQVCARIMEDRCRLGESLDDHVSDAFIAAIAITHDLIIVTWNESEFRKTQQNRKSRRDDHGPFRP